MLNRINSAGEQLPINQFPAFTVCMWAKVNGNNQTDLRLFSEASTSNNDPLFNLGTGTAGGVNKVDILLRQSGWTTVNHIQSDGEPLDDTWHHIAFVQQADGSRALYFDGVKDTLEIPAKEPGDWRINTTSIGGILRANPTHWITGLLDDVAMWNRALSEAELKQVVSEGLSSVFSPIAQGMVAYWPMDEVVGAKTPDLVNGYDMQLQNLTTADLVPGKVGKTFNFQNTRQTMLNRINSPGEQLPINQFPAFTVSMWAKVLGNNQTDLRLFSEASTSNNDPLFNLGTGTAGGVNKVDILLRQSGWTTVNHIQTDSEPLDDTWHHIAFIQQADGSRAMYTDGVKDTLEIPVKEAGDWRLNTTSIGGILRANPTHWITGLLDDVALWNSALTDAELNSVITNGTPVPFTKPLPLVIRAFKADRPAVVVGDKVWLRWDVTKNVQVSIDQGVGDVTAQTVSGLGAVQIPISDSRTYKLTVTRGTETMSQSVDVAAIDGVTAGWTLLDNFDRYPAGFISGLGGWADLDSGEMLVVDLNGNKLLAANNADALGVLRLGPLAVVEGQQRTLFFRVYRTGDEAEPVRGMAALTDRNVRFGSDGGTAGNDIGPGAVLSDEAGIGLQIGGANGTGATVDFAADPLLAMATVYNVWVDMKNGPFPADQSSTGDTYSIYIQKDGPGQRTTVVTDYVSARGPGAADVGFATKDLDKLVVCGLTGNSTTTNLYYDDFYLSQSGYNSTTPRAFGFTAPVGPASKPTLAITTSGGQISITWSGGTLESTGTVNTGWAAVPDATASPYKVSPAGAQRFYRVKQ
jgi:Concanavalin A-like lectin/glucanases superfamily